MQQTYYKIIGITFKTFFLAILCFLFSNVVSAASLSLPSNFNSSILENQILNIPVKTSDNKPGVVISFAVAAQEASFNPAQCTTNSTGSCSVGFKATRAGSYPIGITAPGYITNFAPTIVVTQSTPNTTSTTTYVPLAPLPGLTTFDASSPTALGDYINIIIKLTIGISAVLAVLMIIMGGLEYITSELPGAKGEGKQRITNAVVGLLIALGAWIVLDTINPNLLNTDLSSLTPTIIQFTEGPEIDGDPSVICGKTNKQGIVSCDNANLVNITFLGKGVTIHRSIVADLQIIDAAWKSSKDPAIKNYIINSVGGFNPRSATGNSSTPSAHAFGLAIDINPSTNPYINSSSPCTTDMPLAFVKLFTSRGFGWGGYWKTKKDAMHFSRASNEAGYTTGTCSGLK